MWLETIIRALRFVPVCHSVAHCWRRRWWLADIGLEVWRWISRVGLVWWRRARARWVRCCQIRTAAPAEAGWTRPPTLGRTAVTTHSEESTLHHFIWMPMFCKTSIALHIRKKSTVTLEWGNEDRFVVFGWTVLLKQWQSACKDFYCWAEVKLGLYWLNLHHLMILFVRRREIYQYTWSLCRSSWWSWLMLNWTGVRMLTQGYNIP